PTGRRMNTSGTAVVIVNGQEAGSGMSELPYRTPDTARPIRVGIRPRGRHSRPGMAARTGGVAALPPYRPVSSALPRCPDSGEVIIDRGGTRSACGAHAGRARRAPARPAALRDAGAVGAAADRVPPGAQRSGVLLRRD